MALPAHEQRLSVEEYLRHEDGAAFRSEYVDGRLFAMVGASDAHNIISMNVAALLWNAARGSACRVYQSDMKVRPLGQVFYYPDVMVVCRSEPDETHFKRSPCLIVEVLSPSTAVIDRGEKLRQYTQMPSLEAYVLLEQHEQRAEVYRRGAEGLWTYQTLEADALLALPCPQITLSLAEVYGGVPLLPPDEPFAPPRL